MVRRQPRPFEERARRKQRDALIRREFARLGRRDVTVDPARLMSGLSDDLEAAVAGWRERLPDLADAAARRGTTVAAGRLGVDASGWDVDGDVVGLGRKALWRVPASTLTDFGRLFTGDVEPGGPALRAGLASVLGGAGGTASMVVNSTEGVVFNANSAAVFESAGQSWQWVARCGPTTCAFCWAQHGQVFGPDETLDSHPNCACEMRPVSNVAAGVDVFAAAAAATQRAVLGPVGYEAWKTGEFDLPDLVAHKKHPVLGRVGGTASLTDVLGADRVKELRSKVLYGR